MIRSRRSDSPENPGVLKRISVLRRGYSVGFAAVLALPMAMHNAGRGEAQEVPATLPAGDRIAVEQCVVRFAEEVDIPALETGVLAEVRVRQNSIVRAGDLLVRLDDHALLIRRRAAQLQREAAEEQLRDELELQFARTVHAEAQAELESNRAVNDLNAGAIPASLIRKLRLSVERGQLEIERAKKTQRLAQIEVNLRSADLQLLDDQLRRLKVESPVAGVVLTLNRHAGEWVTAGDAVARVARLDQLHVQALLTATQLPPAEAVGAPVTVRWGEGEEERALQGRVISTDPQMLSGGRYRLHAEIENRLVGDSWLLLPGTEVRMTVHRSAARSANRSRSAAGTRR